MIWEDAAVLNHTLYSLEHGQTAFVLSPNCRQLIQKCWSVLYDKELTIPTSFALFYPCCACHSPYYFILLLHLFWGRTLEVARFITQMALLQTCSRFQTISFLSANFKRQETWQQSNGTMMNLVINIRFLWYICAGALYLRPIPNLFWEGQPLMPCRRDFVLVAPLFITRYSLTPLFCFSPRPRLIAFLVLRFAKYPCFL